MTQPKKRISTALGKRIFFALARRIEHGCLVIHCQGETHVMGDEKALPRGEMKVHDPHIFYEILTGGEYNLGMGYTKKKWDSPSPYRVVLVLVLNEPVFRRTISRFHRFSPSAKWLTAKLNKRMGNTIALNEETIGEAYDVGNDFFEVMLGPTMTFTCAIWPTPEASLEDAQEHKMNILIRKLKAEPGHEVLEVGCGWGLFASKIRHETGARVTGITLSREQLKVCEQRDPEVTWKYTDYSQVEGRFDRIISVGMFEHVGRQYIDDYVQSLANLLKPGGRLVLHGMIYNNEIFYMDEASGLKYNTFPSLLMPGTDTTTHGQLQRAGMKTGCLRVLHSETFGIHYARTCRAWYQNMKDHRQQLIDKHGEELYRAYTYAWAIGASAMETGTSLLQIVFEKKAFGSSLKESVL